jgi:upstream activation factor subunit UAF30
MYGSGSAARATRDARTGGPSGPGKRAEARSNKEVHVAKKAGAKRKPNAKFMAPLNPSSALAEVIGAKALPRTEVTKKIWQYIKKNGLQDKKNRRMINADEKLLAVFGNKKQVSMFEMTKLVSKHLK